MTMVGKNLSHYKIVSELGRGGMGVAINWAQSLSRLMSSPFEEIETSTSRHLSQNPIRYKPQSERRWEEVIFPNGGARPDRAQKRQNTDKTIELFYLCSTRVSLSTRY